MTFVYCTIGWPKLDKGIKILYKTLIVNIFIFFLQCSHDLSIELNDKTNTNLILSSLKNKSHQTISSSFLKYFFLDKS